MFDFLTQWLTLDRVENILIALGGAIIGTFGGAYAGALAAARIATRKAQRAELLARIVECNAGISLAFAICSRALNYKEDSVLDMHGQFMRMREAIEMHHVAIAAGDNPAPLHVDMNFRKFHLMQAPAERLETVLLEKLSVRGRPLQMAITLTECVQSLNQCIADRNQLIDYWQASELPADEQVAFVHGFVTARGQDTSFLDAVNGIMQNTDDCIWFSRTLIEDLVAHARKLRGEFKRRWRGALPELTRSYLHAAQAKGLFPDDEKYKDWRTAFVKNVPRTRGRWGQRLKYAALREIRTTVYVIPVRRFLKLSRFQRA